MMASLWALCGTLQKWRMVWGLQTSHHRTHAGIDRQKDTKREVAFSILKNLLINLSVSI